MSNIRVNEENFRKQPRNIKLSLKKALSATLALTIMSTSIYGIQKAYTNISVPEGYSYSGTNIDTDDKINIENVKDKFVMIEVNNWGKGISRKSVENMNICEQNNIPYGILLNSSAVTPKQAQADAACILALTENRNIDCPMYYNVDTPAETLSNEELISLCDSFKIVFDKESENEHSIGFAGKVETLDKLNGKFDDLNKMVVCHDKEIDYKGDYNMCYYTRTKGCYSNVNYSKENNNIVAIDNRIEDSTTKKAKGIDVSEFQGDIDWDAVKEQGVEYAIIRFSSFKSFHSDGNKNIDKRFFENVSECERLGIPYGIYCYTTADTEAEAIDEARVVVDTLNEMGGIKMSLPIYYDIEMKKHFENPELSARLINAFKSVVGNAGYDSAVYASYSLLKQIVSIDPSIKNEKNWVAYYKYDDKRSYDEVYESHIPEMTDIGPYSFVQVTQKGVLEGIKENTVDVNFDVTGLSKENFNNRTM